MENPPQIKKAYVDTQYGQLHYRQIQNPSSTKPILLFLHKSASSSVSMERLMLHYATSGYTSYAPDMPGFGGSFDPDEPTIKLIEEKGSTWYCEVYADAFKALDIWDAKRGVHILGHHSGASLGPELASMYPDIVRSVCLVGASLYSAQEREMMKAKLLHAFNQPVVDGSHLQKTWTYLGRMGVTSSPHDADSPPTTCSDEDLEIWHRELVDHVRAWKGRMQIYAAIWSRDSEGIFQNVRSKIMVLCARDDVLWEFFGNAKRLRDDVECHEVGGANFTVDRDVEGIVKVWTPFLEKAESGKEVKL